MISILTLKCLINWIFIECVIFCYLNTLFKYINIYKNIEIFIIKYKFQILKYSKIVYCFTEYVYLLYFLLYKYI